MESGHRGGHRVVSGGRLARHQAMVAIAILVMIAPGGCRFATTRIGDIQSRPADYLGREVTVAGSVTDSIKLPFLPGLYSIKDGSGVISVLTNAQVPLSGERVRIRARVATAATIGGQTVGLHLSELQRY